MLLSLLALSVLGAEPPKSYTVIDLMPAFWEFQVKAEKLPVAEQGKLFQKTLVARYPEVYRREVLSFDDSKPLPDQLQERYLIWQPLIAPHLPLMRKVSAQIAKDLPAYEKSFRKVFPDFAYRGEVYFLASLGGFDGANRQVKGTSALLFGVDMIAFVYGEKADPQPFFHHELFHIYHSQYLSSAESDPLYVSLWSEGLAEYVAKSLNPSAEGVALFGLPETMPARAQAMLPKLAKELRGKLDSLSRDDYSRFFLGKEDQGELPGRSGYYVGYLVAQKLGKGRSLTELARLKGPVLRSEVERALVELEGVDAGR